MKTVCIYHSVDLDGWMSAAIVKHWFNSTVEIPNKKDEPINTLDFIGYNYGQPIPDLSEYDKVIMCDISFPKEEMDDLRESKEVGNFIWLDHHISAIQSCSNYPYGIRDTNYAACELTWKYFFPDEPMPEIVRLLGRYDCFGHKGTYEELKVLKFQYAARAVITNYIQAYLYLTSIDQTNRDEVHDQIISFHKAGAFIYKYLCTEAEQIYKNSFPIELSYLENKYSSVHKKVKFLCVNKERFNPVNFGIDYHKDGYDGVACFWYTGKDWAFSLYNDNGEVDCSMIAKQYGGGGHKGAAGFRVNSKELLNIING